MKTFPYRHLRFICLIAGLIVMTAGCREHHITIQIDPNGTCTVTTESVFARMVLKQQLRMTEAYLKSSGEKIEGIDPELLQDTPEDDETADANQNPNAPDERMKKKILAFYAALYANGPQISSVEIEGNDVRIQFKTEYDSLEKFFENPEFVYQLGYKGMRLQSREREATTLTLYRDPEQPNALTQRIQKMSSQSFSGSLKFALPGKITESSLDHIKDDTTWSTLDPGDDKTYARQLAALDQPVVITFEPNGLTLSGVLDSQKVRELASESTKLGGSLPLTEASQDYFAEAMSVTTTQIIPLAGREVLAQKKQGALSRESEGIVVYARLYAPQGRHFLAMHSLKIAHAKDDHNRRLVVPEEDLSKAGTHFDPTRQQAPDDQIDVVVRLPLPDFALNAIETMELETELVTCDGWQSHRIAGNSLKAEGEYDLSAIFDNGRLVIKDLKKDSAEFGEMVLELTGTGNPYELKVAMELFGRRLNLYTSDESENENLSNGQLIRLHYYLVGTSLSNSERHPDLIILRPTDMKREMVRFQLSEIDLH